MASTIQVRVDDDLKTKSDALFKDLGTDTTTAIRMFLTQALAVNGFPFEIKRANANPYEALTEHEIKEISESNKGKRELVQFSGYCMINLIANQIEKTTQPINENVLVNNVFVEYDYENRNNRPPNNYFINAAHSYLERSNYNV